MAVPRLSRGGVCGEGAIEVMRCDATQDGKPGMDRNGLGLFVWIGFF